MAKLEMYTEEERKKLADVLVQNINNEFRIKRINDKDNLYNVILQGNEFQCLYSDEEMQKTAELVFDLIEKIKEKIASGLNMDVLNGKLHEARRSVDSDDGEDFLNEMINTTIHTKNIMDDSMQEMYLAIAKQMRVGGAYLIFSAGPAFRSAIFSCYDLLLRVSEDEEVALTVENPEYYACHMLLRAAMNMHPVVVRNEEEN